VVIRIKNLVCTLFVAVLSLTLISGVAVVNASVGPAPSSGDGVPSGNQFIQPSTPGMGPAPNAGDGVPDGSGL
jgi:hypothetical protein